MRRCTACEALDLDAMFGRPDLADHAPWRCPGCRSATFVLDRLAL